MWRIYEAGLKSLCNGYAIINWRICFMSKRRKAALQAGLVFVAMFANAASKSNTMRITVLDSVTHSVTLDDSGVPRNCDQLNYDAYCHSSKTEQVTNTLLIQENNGATFRVACTIESKWSKCIPLPKGEAFDARQEKHGITIYYADDDGKPRRQLYAFVGPTQNAGAAAPAPLGAAPAVVAPAVAAPAAVAPVQNAAPVADSATAQEILPEKVRCNFRSSPPGAEITVDGRYMGSTPSEIGLTPGTHVVVISMTGFAQWKRELTVATDSELNVTAALQKTQP